MDNKANIGNKIKEARLTKNLSMEEVCLKNGISRSTLWSIESGKGNYSIDVLLKLMNYLNLSFEIKGEEGFNKRKRASRINTATSKRINRFIIMCVEQYAHYINKGSKETYNLLLKNEIIKELIDDYEDMHGLSNYEINDYISYRIKRPRKRV